MVKKVLEFSCCTVLEFSLLRFFNIRFLGRSKFRVRSLVLLFGGLWIQGLTCGRLMGLMVLGFCGFRVGLVVGFAELGFCLCREEGSVLWKIKVLWAFEF